MNNREQFEVWLEGFLQAAAQANIGPASMTWAQLAQRVSYEVSRRGASFSGGATDAKSIDTELGTVTREQTKAVNALPALTFDLLRRENIIRCEASTGFNHSLKSWSVAEWGNATAGEIGEACNVAKKMLRFRDLVAGNDPKITYEEYRRQLSTEIAGAVIYADLWAAASAIDLGAAVTNEWNRKSEQIGFLRRI